LRVGGKFHEHVFSNIDETIFSAIYDALCEITDTEQVEKLLELKL